MVSSKAFNTAERDIVTCTTPAARCETASVYSALISMSLGGDGLLS